MNVSEDELNGLYTWVSCRQAVCAFCPLCIDGNPEFASTQVDEIPLSRPKRNIARDFSDGGEL